MKRTEPDKWFKQNVLVLEKDYLIHSSPRKQSGFSGSLYKWIKCRKPIAACINKNGTFLDIGCANGYLLQSIIKWKLKERIKIIPYGLDIGSKLIEHAKRRFPDYPENFFNGNTLTWSPPFKFDFVRTELVYVPPEFRKKLIQRLLKDFIKPGGKLLLCEYRSSSITHPSPLGRRTELCSGCGAGKPTEWIDMQIKKLGYAAYEIKSGFYKGKELSRIVVIKK